MKSRSNKNTACLALTLTAVSALSSCAISSKTYLPDGSEGYSISCDGSAVGINVCFEKAGELCGARGYELLNREGQIIPAGTGVANNQGAFVNYGAYNTKSIMIRCGH
jgi:hypothetical protein